jgi:GNAT superfamily N-acetyltransferase
MPPVTADIHIKPLASTPEFFTQVAAWHHQECERQGLKSSLELRQQRLQLHIQNKSVPQTLVAIAQGEAIGCVSLVNYNFRTDNSVLIPRSTSHIIAPLWLSNLFVCEAVREQGVGTRLINAAVHYARALELSELWLSAAEFTGFYQKRGWEVTRRTRLGGRAVNIMKRELTLL